MNRIVGKAQGRSVRFDEQQLNPWQSQQVYNHSPDGFAWGYGGSGPAQLALAILLAAGVDQKLAVALHQEFKREFLVSVADAMEDFTLEVDVQAWAEEKAKHAG